MHIRRETLFLIANLTGKCRQSIEPIIFNTQIMEIIFEIYKLG